MVLAIRLMSCSSSSAPPIEKPRFRQLRSVMPRVYAMPFRRSSSTEKKNNLPEKIKSLKRIKII
jgi:hypothetical protein